MLEFGTFLRAVNDRPYEWMTIGCLEFDGDSHESSEHWFGMTVLFEALLSSANSNLSSLPRFFFREAALRFVPEKRPDG